MKKDSLRLSLFAPLERDTPLVELLDGDDVLLDISYEGDTTSGEVVVMFHDAVAKRTYPLSSITNLVEDGVKRLEEES